MQNTGSHQGNPKEVASLTKLRLKAKLFKGFADATRLAIFEALNRTLPDKQGEIQLTDAIRLLIHKGEPVYAWLLPPGQRRYDVGNFESYFQAFIDFALADERYGYLVRKYIKAKAYEL